MRQVLDEVVDQFAERAARNGISLSCQVWEDVPAAVRGDPARLRQILINLVGNAFSVRDIGIGIPADTRARIFDSFTQADESTTRKYGGTGLGLSIAKQLTELMGGAIGVESEAGKGSTFWFTARFAPALAPVQSAAPAEAHDPGVSYEMKPEILRRWSINILLVEDNPLNQEVTRSLLEMFGCRVDVAVNGRQALDRLVGSSYDLVFLDCQMPEMDGFATAMAIRRREALQSRVQAVPATSPALPSTNGLGALRSSRVLQVLHWAAHTLKSNSASLGARTLATICGELEAMGRESRASEAVRLLPALEAEYLAAADILSTELQRSA